MQRTNSQFPISSDTYSRSEYLSEYPIKNKTLSQGKHRLLAALALIFIFSFFYVINNQTVHSTSALQTIVVNEGDTLWSLAGKYAGTTNPWDWIQETKQLNDLNSNEIRSGFHLKIHSY